MTPIIYKIMHLKRSLHTIHSIQVTNDKISKRPKAIVVLAQTIIKLRIIDLFKKSPPAFVVKMASVNK